MSRAEIAAQVGFYAMAAAFVVLLVGVAINDWKHR